MNKNQVGNEINHITTTEMEWDYSHRHNWRCIGRTIVEAFLLASLFLVIFIFCAALQ